jgi:hypothetical protein
MMNKGFGWLLGFGLLAAAACSNEPPSPGGDTQTNWLKTCTLDSECGELSCECGICSLPCASDAECNEAPAGVGCFAPDSAEVLAACGTGAASGVCLRPLSAAPRAPTALEFPAAFYAAYCEHVSNCACGATAVENCNALAASDTGTDGLLTRALELVDEGVVVYDPAAAGSLLERLRDPALPCGEFAPSLGIDSYRAKSFDGVFVGTVPAGGPCEGTERKDEVGVTRCSENHRCLTGADGTSTCVPIAGLGEPCPVLPDQLDSSCLVRREADADGEFNSSFEDLSCIADAPGSALGTCRRDAPDGSACFNSEQCVSGRCAIDDTFTSWSCVPLVADGELCSSDADCTSKYCDSRNLCAQPAANGVACASSSACTSGFCDLPDGGVTGTCAEATLGTLAARGAPCADDSECASGNCEVAVAGGTCLEHVCGGLF